MYAARERMTVRGKTRAGLGSRPNCVDWLGLWVEEEDGEGEEDEEEEDEDEEELEQKEAGVLEALEVLGVESAAPWESHSCLQPIVAVALSKAVTPSGGQVEMDGFWKESLMSDELTPFSAKEPGGTKRRSQINTDNFKHHTHSQTIFYIQ